MLGCRASILSSDNSSFDKYVRKGLPVLNTLEILCGPRRQRSQGPHPTAGTALIMVSQLLLLAGVAHHSFHHTVEVEAAGLLPWRELLEALQPLPDICCPRAR